MWINSWTTKTSVTESTNIGLSEWHGSLNVNHRRLSVWHWRNYFPKTTMRWKSFCIRKQNAQQKSTKLFCDKTRIFLLYFISPQHFRNFPLGQKFLIVTNHRALTKLYSFMEPDGFLARWIEKLGQFDFEINHEAGKKIPHADCLSHRPKTKSKSSIKWTK